MPKDSTRLPSFRDDGQPVDKSRYRLKKAVAGFLSFMLLMLFSCCNGETETITYPGNPNLPGGTTTNTLLLGVNAFSRPAENISREHLLQFFSGNSFFNRPWVQAPASTIERDGLGPLFNARACSSCHFKDGRAEPPPDPEAGFGGLLIRLSIPGEDEHGGPLGDPTYGTQFQPFSISDVDSEGRPSLSYEEIEGAFDDGQPYTLIKPNYSFPTLNYGPMDPSIMLSPRIAPQVIGLGLLEAISEDRLRELADPDDLDEDGISGRLNIVWDETKQADAAGRFGWKAEQPSVAQQVAGAFHGDIGISSSIFSGQSCTDAQTECVNAIHGGAPEVNDRMLGRTVLYTSLLAVPARRNFADPDVKAGEHIFRQLNCDGCHVPYHRTGEHEFEEVVAQDIFPYTDLLLHDMGEALSDNRPAYKANGREWRTPPLWGLNLIKSVNGHSRLLHDGRARNFNEAILWHGGEAEQSQREYSALSATDRSKLIRFLESL